VGGGRSLFAHFADVMRRSDFQSFSRWRARRRARREGDDGGAAQLRPGDARVLLPLDASTPALDERLSAFLSPRDLRELRRKGLFALSFMDTGFLKGRPSTLASSRTVRRSGCFRCGLGPGASG
jgi:hypothetical protein